MATQIVPALTSADRQAPMSVADRAAHDAASYVRAPADATTRYDSVAAHYQELAAAGDYEGCLDAADEMAMRLRQQAMADRADLIRVA
ncbi:hypothetical protein [Streptomyces sp. NPDC096324]|uniref:hypothetical protein n=1 Tax=Streptomyces sp. NPDC096324 TaxID=3366085 RepID=UPI0037F31C9F